MGIIRKSSLILVLLITCQPLWAQEDRDIQEIRAKCEAINESKSYKKVQVFVEDLSAEGGFVIGYFAGDELKKIALKL